MDTEQMAELALQNKLLGLYPASEVSNENYHSGPGLSSSGVRTLFTRGPSVFHWQYLSGKAKPRPTSAAMKLGTAVHCAILEPERFDREYASDYEIYSRTGFNRNKTDYKKEVELVEATGRKLLEYSNKDGDTYQKVLEMRDAILSTPEGILLFGDAIPEESLYWNEDVDGEVVVCKARCDSRKWIDDVGAWVIADIKTTSSPVSQFQKEIGAWHYHMQAAHYVRGVQAVTGKPCIFCFVVIETEPPYPVRFMNPIEQALEKGFENNRKALQLYTECRKSGKWGAYKSEVARRDSMTFEPVDLPAWSYYE